MKLTNTLNLIRDILFGSKQNVIINNIKNYYRDKPTTITNIEIDKGVKNVDYRDAIYDYHMTIMVVITYTNGDVLQIDNDILVMKDIIIASRFLPQCINKYHAFINDKPINNDSDGIETIYHGVIKYSNNESLRNLGKTYKG